MKKEVKKFDTARKVIEFIESNGREVKKSIIGQDDSKHTNGYSRYYVEIIGNKIVDAWRETDSAYVSPVSFLV